MIGIYDSWVGWLYTAQLFKKKLPKYNYIILADNAVFPLGEKTPEEIKTNTFKALDRLFDHGAKLVIIACNTAAAYSVRAWQTQFPEKKVLSITIPGIEELINYQHQNNIKNIWVLATRSTIFSWIYTDLFTRLGGKWNPNFECVISSDLIDAIEHSPDDSETEKLIEKYCKIFSSTPEILVLWCTHFSLVKSIFEKYFNWIVIDPSEIAAQKLKLYLNNHPEIDDTLSKNWEFKYYSTGTTTYRLDFLEGIHFEKIIF